MQQIQVMFSQYQCCFHGTCSIIVNFLRLASLEAQNVNWLLYFNWDHSSEKHIKSEGNRHERLQPHYITIAALLVVCIFVVGRWFDNSWKRPDNGCVLETTFHIETNYLSSHQSGVCWLACRCFSDCDGCNRHFHYNIYTVCTPLSRSQ